MWCSLLTDYEPELMQWKNLTEETVCDLSSVFHLLITLGVKSKLKGYRFNTHCALAFCLWEAESSNVSVLSAIADWRKCLDITHNSYD